MHDRDIVIVSTQDYDDLLTRKQRWAARLARSNRVLYIESQMHWITLLRTWPEHRSRLQWCGAHPRRVAENLWVWTPPIVLPLFQMWTPLARFNNWLLGRRLLRVTRALGFRTDVLWLYTPYSADLIDILRPQRVVYECVDDFSAARGLIRSGTVKALEETTVRRADMTVVTAERLADRLRDRSANLRLSPNACDIETIGRAANPETPIHPMLATLQRPVYGFVGAVAYWVDLDLLASLAKSDPGGSVVLVGPVRVDIRRYREIPNLLFLGRQPADRIPEFLRGFDVCLNPYKPDNLSYGASPLKLYEYLASGKPVVSTDMPEAHRFEGIVRIADNRESFFAQCTAAVDESPDEATHRRDCQIAIAQGQTWGTRFCEVEQWFDELDHGHDGPSQRASLTLHRGPESVRTPHVLINALQVTRPELGGGYTYLTQLLRHMITAHPKTRFTLLTTRPAAKHFEWDLANLECRTLPSLAAVGPLRVLFERYSAGRFINKYQPDVYFLPYGVLPHRKLCPEVITYQNLYFVHAEEFAEWEAPGVSARLYERLRLWYLTRRLSFDAHRADRIVAVSQTAAQDLVERLGVDTSIVSVSYEGSAVDAPDPHESDHDSETIRLLRIPERFFLSVGAIAPNKNLPALLDAYSVLREADPDAPALVLAGPDWNRFSRVIDAQVRALNLTSHVYRLGFVPTPTLTALYRTAVATVQLSGCESFGLPALEAMSIGCPVICADRSGLAEIGGDAAVLVDPHSRMVVADALKRMAADPAWRAQWIRRGRRRANAFSWDMAAEVTYTALARAANWKTPEPHTNRRTAAPSHEPRILEEV